MTRISTLNETRYNEFELQIKQSPPVGAPIRKCFGIEWLEDDLPGAEMSPFTVEKLSNRSLSPLRIIFAPPDIPDAKTGPLVLELCKHYAIPANFVSERLRHVSFSFGTADGDGKSNYTWFHSLCKDVYVQDQDGVKRIMNRNNQGMKEISQGDFGWVRSAYCLVQREVLNSQTPEVTLITFGAEKLLFERFKTMAMHTSCKEILQDPYRLFGFVFEVLYERIDTLTWNVAKVYTQDEMKVLHMSSGDSNLTDLDLDFPGLHMIQRTQVYLREAIEGITVTLEAVTDQHKLLLENSPKTSFSISTQADFRYRKTMIKSTDLRLQSMERRTESTINLAFNLVTQTDSRVMKGDSAAMKRISILTMIYLPATAVATFFSTPFFYVNDGSGALDISPYLWAFWAVSVPLTVVTIALFFAWSKDGQEFWESLFQRKKQKPCEEEGTNQGSKAAQGDSATGEKSTES